MSKYLITLFIVIFATSSIASDNSNKGHNTKQGGGSPFVSGSEALKSCLKDVFGEKDFEAYANNGN